jgi:hypothetical protein
VRALGLGFWIRSQSLSIEAGRGELWRSQNVRVFYCFEARKVNIYGI